MYAVIICGGKQYRVQEGDVLKIETVDGDVGSTVHFDKVLLVGEGETVTIGTPFLDGCRVAATVVSEGRHDKIRIVKFRRRKHHLKWMGHRQNYTEIKITGIQA